MISFISKLYHSLTWKRVLLYVVVSILGLIGYTVYEQRDRVFAPLLPSPGTNAGLTFSVSKRTESEIREAMSSFPGIVGVAVMSADLRANEALTVFFAQTVSTEAFSIIKKYPIFSNQEDSNIAAIKLINGEFSCGPFNRTPVASLVPALGESVKTTCRISIPSYYGYFSGFITIFLSIDPDHTQQQQIKLVFSSLSTGIYFKDVLPTLRSTLGQRLL